MAEKYCDEVPAFKCTGHGKGRSKAVAAEKAKEDAQVNADAACADHSGCDSPRICMGELIKLVSIDDEEAPKGEYGIVEVWEAKCVCKTL